MNKKSIVPEPPDSDCEDKDLIVNYVCCGFRQVNINTVREYSNGNWKFK